MKKTLIEFFDMVKGGSLNWLFKFFEDGPIWQLSMVTGLIDSPVDTENCHDVPGQGIMIVFFNPNDEVRVDHWRYFGKDREIFIVSSAEATPQQLAAMIRRKGL